ncbi:pseudouridine synthase [Salibacterium halotolerans]|uniref:Pseudouridine synthase n=1 Tax=Salibacterium halotolerans TaxID=1884432 RepID=A0A1I5R4V2_9BACI|nr:pseudouridine synthase [Salibacterium halotolerans]SFP53594.1 16S rRNA pseudouridine516 synthase [Salibacterium halotolerans]
MRADKLLANTGFGTRKDVKKLLKQGAVTADGEKVKSGAVHLDPDTQKIEVKGEPLVYREYIYLLMHKPAGVICATEDELHETVLDILEWEDVVRSPFPVGRLDKDTEGLLLLTNDGKFSHALTSPKKGVPKIYEALLDQPASKEDAEVFSSGVTLDDGYRTKPADLQRFPEDPDRVRITIGEGKYHQVKRMVEAVGKKVLYLKRIQIGSLELDEELEAGEYREMEEEEVQQLLDEAYHRDKKEPPR